MQLTRLLACLALALCLIASGCYGSQHDSENKHNDDNDFFHIPPIFRLSNVGYEIK